MRGLDHIIAMRRSGFKPAYVALTDAAPMPELLDDVQYEAGDVPELHDLRALVGLFVVVEGRDARTVGRWSDAALKAGAFTVLACVHEVGREDSAVWTHRRLNGVDQ